MRPVFAAALLVAGCDIPDPACELPSTDVEECTDPQLWFADLDQDGDGDPDDTISSCIQPIGYVSNADDCDDRVDNDQDDDGVQDCGDPDIDGDGLRNEWDAAPWDPSIVRGPHGGIEDTVDLIVTGTEVFGQRTRLVVSAEPGATELQVADASAFDHGQEVLILTLQGPDAGHREMVFVDTASNGALTIEPPLRGAFDADEVVTVRQVFHFRQVVIEEGARLSSAAWDGDMGGVLAIRAQQGITVRGTVDADAFGFFGGAGVYGNADASFQGESFLGLGQAGLASNNLGGGGGGQTQSDQGNSGAGGGFGSTGVAGTGFDGNTATIGGTTYGTSDLAGWYLGSGGGGGAPDEDEDGSGVENKSGDGGRGGGIVAFFTDGPITVEGTGRIRANGEAGDGGVAPFAFVGGGGGGSGGTIFLSSPTVLVNGLVSAVGGQGGPSQVHGLSWDLAAGGQGGVGRIGIDYETLETNPPGGITPHPGREGTWTPDPPDPEFPDPTPIEGFGVIPDPGNTDIDPGDCPDGWVQGGRGAHCSSTGAPSSGFLFGLGLLLFGRRRSRR